MYKSYKYINVQSALNELLTKTSSVSEMSLILNPRRP